MPPLRFGISLEALERPVLPLRFTATVLMVLSTLFHSKVQRGQEEKEKEKGVDIADPTA